MLPLLKVEASVKLGEENPGATDTSVRGLLTTRRSKASLGRKTCKAVGSVSVGAVPIRKSAGRERWGCLQSYHLAGRPARQWAVWVLCQVGRVLIGEVGLALRSCHWAGRPARQYCFPQKALAGKVVQAHKAVAGQ